MKKLNKHKPRGIFILLKILRDNASIKVTKSWFGLKVEYSIHDGLCCEVIYLLNKKMITSQECDLLNEYIETYMPYYDKNDNYGWQPKLWLPRLEWLNKQINGFNLK
jgi:hypothetical protein